MDNYLIEFFNKRGDILSLSPGEILKKAKELDPSRDYSAFENFTPLKNNMTSDLYLENIQQDMDEIVAQEQEEIDMQYEYETREEYKQFRKTVSREWIDIEIVSDEYYSWPFNATLATGIYLTRDWWFIKHEQETRDISFDWRSYDIERTDGKWKYRTRPTKLYKDWLIPIMYEWEEKLEKLYENHINHIEE